MVSVVIDLVEVLLADTSQSPLEHETSVLLQWVQCVPLPALDEVPFLGGKDITLRDHLQLIFSSHAPLLVVGHVLHQHTRSFEGEDYVV